MLRERLRASTLTVIWFSSVPAFTSTYSRGKNDQVLRAIR
jgi:hypothetical protein